MKENNFWYLLVGAAIGYAIATYTQRHNGKPAYIQGGTSPINSK